MLRSPPCLPCSALGTAGLLFALVVSAHGKAPEREPPLLPTPDLMRPPPAPPRAEQGRVRGGCSAEPLPPLEADLPFGPGERLSYDVSVLGIRTGHVSLAVAEREVVDQVSVYPLYARAKTSGFISVLGSMDGRMVSFLDPRTLTPVRMANRFLIDVIGRDTLIAREDAAFHTSRVAARLTYEQAGKKKTRPAKLTSTSDLVDVLSVVYYMRARALDAPRRFCFEVYHRRRLWRVEGHLGEIEVVHSKIGARPARRIEGTLRRLGGASKVRRVTAWVSHDGDRLPLIVETPDRLGTLRVELKAFQPGRRLMRAGD